MALGPSRNVTDLAHLGVGNDAGKAHLFKEKGRNIWLRLEARRGTFVYYIV